MKITRPFIEAIPKTDLHVHLDGSIRLSTLIELARERKIRLPSYTEAGLKEKVFKSRYRSLAEYLQGFQYTTAVLQDGRALERAAFELAEDGLVEGVRYMEVRFAPQLHQGPELSFLSVLKAVDRGLGRAKMRFNAKKEVVLGLEPPFEYGLLLCAMRMFGKNYSPYFDALWQVHHHSEDRWIYQLASLELVKAAIDARDRHGLPVVGIDLAGMEKGYPASTFKEAYALAHKNFLKKTVHAGEDYGPESIFQAITDLHADRIGHGVHLFNAGLIRSREIRNKRDYVRDLVEYIADRRTTVEVCLTSNLQSQPGMKSLKQHSFAKMRRARLSYTFCTDNRTVSSTTVSDEIEKAVRAFKLTPKELKESVIYGFKRSFFPGSYLAKRRYVRRIIDYYEKIEARASP